MKNTLILSIILLFTFAGCKKDSDPTNYITAGTNVNQVKTLDFTVNSIDWIGSGTSWYYDKLNLPSDMNLSGSVNIYLKNSNGMYVALPLTFSGITVAYSFFTWGEIEIDVTGTSSPGINTFRLVNVPPGAIGTYPSVNYNNYGEVKKAFNLKD